MNTNPCDAAPEIFRDNYANTIGADVLAPCVARQLETMGLAVQDQGVPISHEEGFQLPTAPQGWEIIENANVLLHFLINKIHIVD